MRIAEALPRSCLHKLRGQPIRSRRARRRDPVTPRRDDFRTIKEKIYRLHVDVFAAARDRARRRVRLVADEIFSGTRRRCLSGLQNLSLPAHAKNSTTPSTPHVVRSALEATASLFDRAPPNLSMLRTDTARLRCRPRVYRRASGPIPRCYGSDRPFEFFDGAPTKCICSRMTRDNSTAAYPRPPSLFLGA